MDCLFCKLVQKKIPPKTIYENDKVLAFLDIQPLAPGHTVVIPKIHAENILDLKEEEVKPLFTAVKRVTAILDKNIKPAGFTLGINHGKVAGQSVDHLHIHIIPRFTGDLGGSIHSIINNPPKESIDKIRNKILKNLDK